MYITHLICDNDEKNSTPLQKTYISNFTCNDNERKKSIILRETLILRKELTGIFNFLNAASKSGAIIKKI